jgi:DNA-binding transcriptional LysR family regulator
MTFRHLEAFVATARLASVTRAAESLFLTQPTVSGQIRELEVELGVTLFHRMPRGVELSEAGKLFLPHAVAVLDGRRKLTDEAADYLGLLKGTLEIHTSTIPGEYLLPSLLARFKRDHPALRLICLIHDSAATLEAVGRGEAYLGIVGRSREEPDLEFTPLWEDRLGLYAPPGRIGRARVSLRELADLPLVVREEGSATRKVMEDALTDAGLNPQAFHIVAELGSTTAVKEAVREGIGLSFLSEKAVHCEVEAGRLAEIEVEGFEPVRRRFYLVEDRRRELPPAARTFRTFLLNSLTE